MARIFGVPRLIFNFCLPGKALPQTKLKIVLEFVSRSIESEETLAHSVLQKSGTDTKKGSVAFQ